MSLTSKQQTFLATLLLILLTFVAYFPSLSTQYILDDVPYFIADPLMTAEDGLKRIWLNPIQDNNGFWPYLPIARSSFWLDRQWWGLNFTGYHFVNIALHCLSAILLWLGLKHFFIKGIGKGSWWIGAIFAVHPVHVQSVVWLTERKNVLSGVFYLIALGAYLHFHQKHQKVWYGIAFFSFICGLLSKTSVTMLPALILWILLFWHQPWKFRNALALLPFFLVSLATAVFRIWFELSFFGANRPELDLTFFERLLNAGRIPFFYLNKLLFPYPLMFHYPQWEIPLTQPSVYFFPITLTIVLLILLWKFSTWGAYWLLGMGAFLISLFPVLGFFRNAFTRYSYVTDHWVYLPSIPIIILVVYGVQKGFEKVQTQLPFMQKFQFLLWGGILMTFSFLTWQQTHHYFNEETFWKYNLEKNPQSWLGHNNLGKWYLDHEQWPLALQHLNQATALNPEYGNAFLNRGTVYLLEGNLEKALEDFNRVLVLNPQSGMAYNNRGLIHFDQQKYAAALLDFNQALHHNPQLIKTLQNRASLHLEVFQNTEAACQDWKALCDLDHCQHLLQAQQGRICP